MPEKIDEQLIREQWNDGLTGDQRALCQAIAQSAIFFFGNAGATTGRFYNSVKDLVVKFDVGRTGQINYLTDLLNEKISLHPGPVMMFATRPVADMQEMEP